MRDMEVTIKVRKKIWNKAIKLADSDKEVLAENINQVIDSLLDCYVEMGGLRAIGIQLADGDQIWFDFTHGLLKNT